MTSAEAIKARWEYCWRTYLRNTCSYSSGFSIAQSPPQISMFMFAHGSVMMRWSGPPSVNIEIGGGGGGWKDIIFTNAVIVLDILPFNTSRSSKQSRHAPSQYQTKLDAMLRCLAHPRQADVFFFSGYLGWLSPYLSADLKFWFWPSTQVFLK